MMKTMPHKLCSLLVAVLLLAAAIPAAFAQQEEEWNVVGYAYASNATGYVTLYSSEGEQIGRVANGARLSVTDAQQDGRTYVFFGAVTGWVATEDLSKEAGNNADEDADEPNTLTPIETEPPAEEPVADEEATDDGYIADDEEDGTDIGDIADDEEDGTDTGDIADDEEDGTDTGDIADDEEDGTDTGDTADDEEDSTDTGDTADDEDESTGAGDAADDEKNAEDEATASRSFAAMRELPDGGSETVLVAQVGAAYCLIESEEGFTEVPTAELTFGEDALEQRKVGYVHAPRTGQAGLREQPAKDAKVIAQLKAGQLAAVLEIGEEYALVNVAGQEGWLRLDCLRYLRSTEDGIVSATGKEMAKSNDGEQEKAPEAVTGEAEVLIAVDGQGADRLAYPGKGILICRDDADGGEKVNLRNAPDRNSAKAAVWLTGTEVTVLSSGNGWYLVEAEGICAYVKENFVKLAE